MLDRHKYLKKIQQKCHQFPVVALLGPRQCGKTTLAKAYEELLKAKGQKIHHFDLEDPDDLNLLQNAKLVFERLEGLIILDEIQKLPNLFPLIRVMVDTYQKRFLILGSASAELIHQSSETLAGRIDFIEITPFRLYETNLMDDLWLKGGFPSSFLAQSEEESINWRKAYVRTFLERDIPALGFDINPSLIRRFWNMLCGYHGQIFNASELGNSLDLNHKTVRSYLDILTGTFMIRTLQPWFANIQKRQVKSPKIYFRDSGIFHTFLEIPSTESLLNHHKLGSSWEGFALEEVVAAYAADPQDCFFWSTHAGAEIDLLINSPRGLEGFEFKFSNHPKTTRSITEAIASLDLNHVTIIVPSNVRYPLNEKVSVVGLQEFIAQQS